MSSTCFIYSTDKEIACEMKKANLYENIRSKYILQRLFDILKRKKSLEVIKYNKEIKNILSNKIKIQKINRNKINIYQ